jgi:hypothetical protein
MPERDSPTALKRLLQVLAPSPPDMSAISHRRPAYPAPMSSDLSAEITAIATAVLAAFAIIAGVVASLAFRKQSKAVEDGRELIGQQGAMLQVQSERLEVYRTQVDEQRQINATRLETLDLQAREIRASLDQRERAAEKERRSQAEKVTAWFAEDRHAIWERASATPPTCPSSMSGHSSNTSTKPSQAEYGHRSCGAPPSKGSVSFHRNQTGS